jgi:membrane protein YqaA with SNARE-associated domain
MVRMKTSQDTADTVDTQPWVGRILNHPNALLILCLISFIEASVFPIPPYALLVPMCAALPAKAIRIAVISSLASVAGGLVGYGIGSFASEYAADLIARWGYQQAFLDTQAFVKQWGALSIVISAVTPMPYKIMTITAGLFSMNLPLFIASSIIARGGRFLFAAVVAGKVGEFVQRRRARQAGT